MNKELDMEKYMEDSVKISLYFGGDELPLEEITSRLELEPTSSRKKGEWRAENGYSCDEWVYDLIEIECKDVEELFQKFIEIFGQKTEEIKNISCDYNCKVSVIVVIHMENSEQPYKFFSPSTITFLHEINAEFIMNVWGYSSEESKALQDWEEGYIKS